MKRAPRAIARPVVAGAALAGLASVAPVAAPPPASGEAETERAAAEPVAVAAGKRAKVKLLGSPYGRILFDGKGRALYAFTADRRRKSNCFGDCARAWPPYRLRRRPIAGRGVRQDWLGRIRRRRGGPRRQVTYRGRPLYYYVGDSRPRQVLCQNVFEFGGLWLVVNRRGRPVR